MRREEAVEEAADRCGRAPSRSATGARSSTWCMVSPTRPNSTTGQTSLKKRASDVPPLVDSSGVAAGRLADRRGERRDQRVGPGQEPLAPVGDAEIVWRAVARRNRARRGGSRGALADDQRSLKRTLNRAVASAGMTLDAGLPTSTLVTSRFDGWKSVLPSSRRSVVRRWRRRTSFGTGLSARCGIGDVALAPADPERHRQAAAAADLDHVAERCARRRLADDRRVEAHARPSAPGRGAWRCR